MEQNKGLLAYIALVATGATIILGLSFLAKPQANSENPNLGGGRQFTSVKTVMNGVTATSTSSTLPNATMVKSFTHVVYAVETTGNASGTIKFSGSIFDDPGDPTTTSTITNQHSNILVTDLKTGNSYDGDDGIVVSGTDIHRMFEVEINALAWLRPYLSTYSTGTFYMYEVSAENL